MSEPRTMSADDRFEFFLGGLLRTGVLAAAVVVMVGGSLFLVRHGHERADHHTFHGEPEELTSPIGISRAAMSGQERGIIQLGLLLLLATPVFRVAVSVIAFARERDATYVVLTLVVLALLAYGLFGNVPL